LKALFAPWRLDYLVSEKTAGCVFCEALRSGDDRASLVVHRARRTFVILNRYPYTNGHVMVAPNAHLARLYGTEGETLNEVIRLTALSEGILGRVYHAEGFNIGINLGRAAGAGIADHFHLHVVPRWNGDTNYMSVVGETRVVPEDLGITYDRLKPLYDREAAV
jgi:ATP adenylyltransferase